MSSRQLENKEKKNGAQYSQRIIWRVLGVDGSRSQGSGGDCPRKEGRATLRRRGRKLGNPDGSGQVGEAARERVSRESRSRNQGEGEFEGHLSTVSCAVESSSRPKTKK